MEVVKSSIAGGIAATAVFTMFLLVVDSLLSGRTPRLRHVHEPVCHRRNPYCEPNTLTATALTFLSFLALFALAWPLLFGGFTWGLPG